MEFPLGVLGLFEDTVLLLIETVALNTHRQNLSIIHNGTENGIYDK
jgi:hypothetical protein